MGKPTGFLEFAKENKPSESVKKRIKHFNEFESRLSDRRLITQAARCMDCGVPFCNGGCPVNNLIPEFNDYIYQNRWKAAYGTLQSTNNFPEFTGRVCPAPCEPACCAGLVGEPVAIKMIELAIIEKAFEEGWVKPNTVNHRSDKKIAVIGSGPAGLAAAQQLNLAGHNVTVYEKNEVLGGLLALGIPDFKLEKRFIERRIDLLKREGIEFKTGVHVGVDVQGTELLEQFDYLCLCGGSEKPRDLPVKGRELDGVHFALDFLFQQNRRNGGRDIGTKEITAKGKHVVVIGGGDTGSDCVGTSIRQGAASVTQIEIMPKPPKHRDDNNPWPQWPNTYRTSSSQEEGCKRDFAVLTKEIIGKDKVEKLQCVRVEWSEADDTGRRSMQEIKGSDLELKADLVLLAMGFVHPVHDGLLKELGVELDPRGNVANQKHRTSIDKVYTAGDMAVGQSLVVRAIAEGRSMAREIDRAIKGYTHLS